MVEALLLIGFNIADLVKFYLDFQVWILCVSVKRLL